VYFFYVFVLLIFSNSYYNSKIYLRGKLSAAEAGALFRLAESTTSDDDDDGVCGSPFFGGRPRGRADAASAGVDFTAPVRTDGFLTTFLPMFDSLCFISLVLQNEHNIKLSGEPRFSEEKNSRRRSWKVLEKPWNFFPC